MRYAIRLDQRIQNDKRRSEIARQVAKHLGLVQWSLERQLNRPDKTLLVRTNKRSAAEFIARWLRAYGVRVTIIEFMAHTTSTMPTRTRHASISVSPRAMLPYREWNPTLV